MLKTRTLRGLRTAWIEEGPEGAPSMLLLHGFPDTPETWTRQMAAFSRGRKVLAPYARGIEPSAAGPPERYGPDAIALDHLELLREADPSGRRPVTVVGHDIGAVHAWHLARLLGPRLEALIIVNGVALDQLAGRLGSPRQLRKSWYIPVFLLPWLPERLVRTPLFRLALSRGGFPERSAPPERAAPTLNQYRRAARAALFGGWRRPPRLKAPMLALWGASDAYLEPPSLRELELIAERPTIRVVRGGHWIHEARADRVNGLISSFLEKAHAASH